VRQGAAGRGGESDLIDEGHLGVWQHQQLGDRKKREIVGPEKREAKGQEGEKNRSEETRKKKNVLEVSKAAKTPGI